MKGITREKAKKVAACPTCSEYETQGHVWHCQEPKMEAATELAFRELDKCMKPVQSANPAPTNKVIAAAALLKVLNTCAAARGKNNKLREELPTCWNMCKHVQTHGNGNPNRKTVTCPVIANSA